MFFVPLQPNKEVSVIVPGGVVSMLSDSSKKNAPASYRFLYGFAFLSFLGSVVCFFALFLIFCSMHNCINEVH